MSGKLGNSVMAVRNGVQLARQYQPIVANPSTAAQVANRARLKLMSQLSASLAPVIAIRRIGAVSGRNQFVKRNYGMSAYASGEARMSMADVQLTNSSVGMSGFIVTRASNKLSLSLVDDMSINVDKVVYVVVRLDNGGGVSVLDSVVVDKNDASGVFPAELPNYSGTLGVYAYGIRLATEVGRTAFGNMTMVTAQEIAHLITTSALTEADYRLTETRGLVLAASASEGETSGNLMLNVAVARSSSSVGNGTVSGGGRFAAGSQVTVVATPSADSEFIGWYNANGTNSAAARVSTLASYTFTLGESNVNLYALFSGGNEG